MVESVGGVFVPVSLVFLQEINIPIKKIKMKSETTVRFHS